MCTATLGATPVNACTWAASAIFSCGVRGTPGCANTLNRVPVLPNAHDGSSIRWARNAVFTAVRSGISRHLQAAQHAAVQSLRFSRCGSVKVEYLGKPAEPLVGPLVAEVSEEGRHLRRRSVRAAPRKSFPDFR